jgi:hypothetical protein
MNVSSKINQHALLNERSLLSGSPALLSASKQGLSAEWNADDADGYDHDTS